MIDFDLIDKEIDLILIETLNENFINKYLKCYFSTSEKSLMELFLKEKIRRRLPEMKENAK